MAAASHDTENPTKALAPSAVQRTPYLHPWRAVVPGCADSRREDASRGGFALRSARSARPLRANLCQPARRAHRQRSSGSVAAAVAVEPAVPLARDSTVGASRYRTQTQPASEAPIQEEAGPHHGTQLRRDPDDLHTNRALPRVRDRQTAGAPCPNDARDVPRAFRDHGRPGPAHAPSRY